MDQLRSHFEDVLLPFAKVYFGSHVAHFQVRFSRNLLLNFLLLKILDSLLKLRHFPSRVVEPYPSTER
jgi:hypothetical protein